MSESNSPSAETSVSPPGSRVALGTRRAWTGIGLALETPQFELGPPQTNLPPPPLPPPRTSLDGNLPPPLVAPRKSPSTSFDDGSRQIQEENASPDLRHEEDSLSDPSLGEQSPGQDSTLETSSSNEAFALAAAFSRQISDSKLASAGSGSLTFREDGDNNNNNNNNTNENKQELRRTSSAGLERQKVVSKQDALQKKDSFDYKTRFPEGSPYSSQMDCSLDTIVMTSGQIFDTAFTIRIREAKIS